MRALSSIMYGLLHYYLEDQFAAPEVSGIEPFIDKRGRPLPRPPTWHEPTSDEVSISCIQQIHRSSALSLCTNSRQERLRIACFWHQHPVGHVTGLMLLR